MHKSFIKKINIKTVQNEEVLVVLYIHDESTYEVNLKDFKKMGYGEWRDILVMTKNYISRSYARDQVKYYLIILISKAVSLGELPKGLKDTLNVGILKRRKTRESKLIWSYKS